MKIETLLFDSEMLFNKTVVRAGEVKLGQTIVFGERCLEKTIDYVVIGVKEAIGPLANGGFAGAENAWDCFLNSFLNIQDNMYVECSKIGIYGCVEVSESTSDREDMLKNVAALDAYLEPILKTFFDLDKKVILIGGGHNNAFPLMHALYESKKKTLAVINLDPHADFRLLEGRHSGNSFSYAVDQKILENYGIIGLHQNYNSAEMLHRMHKAEVHFTFFENYLDGERDFRTDISTMLAWMKRMPLGIELDMDAIENMPSSAKTPSGFSLNEARIYLRRCAKQREARYLHLPEAAPKTDDEKKMVGKALAYLVSDFIKVNTLYA
jgi:formiminoglutamase